MRRALQSDGMGKRDRKKPVKYRSNSSAFQLLQGTDFKVDDFLPLIPGLDQFSPHIRQRVGWEGSPFTRNELTLGQYSHGVGRERETSALLMRDEELALPDDLDYFAYNPVQENFNLVACMDYRRRRR